MNRKKLYAAYGSNINLEQMAFRCPDSQVAGTAILKGYELQFKYHATIEPDEESEVPLLLWELSEKDEQTLDRYEGFPKYYRKENITIEINGEKTEAMIYIMNGNRPLEAPTMQYYETIEEGYIENGLDKSYLETALANAIQSETFDMEEQMEMEMY